MTRPTVHLVHCIDTEGPLEESLGATFERIHDRFGLELRPSRQLLERLQKGEEDLGGMEEAVARYVAPERLEYLSRWSDVEAMVEELTAREFRHDHGDTQGGPWVYSWFIIDVVGYRDNPRRKAEGFHAVWDVYQRLLADSQEDSLGWHFHTVPAGRGALEYNTCWTNNDWHEQVLARRIIERQWFPALFRAGGNIERNDVSHWLEQYIPFDYSCASGGPDATRPGDEEDWRISPTTWRPYHPDWYDYRTPGTMRRSMFRCLPSADFHLSLTPEEVDRAFRQAQEHGCAVLAFNSHDRRDIRQEVSAIHAMVKDVANRYPDVDWRNSNAMDAARDCLSLPDSQAPQLSLTVNEGLIVIESDRPIFGPTPFLALQEGECFFRDNPSRESDTCWVYRPRNPGLIRAVGAAAATPEGETSTTVKRFPEGLGKE